MNIPTQQQIEDAVHKYVLDDNGHKFSNNNDEAGDNVGSYIAGASYATQQLEPIITELGMENARRPVWVSVNERLPEPNQYCLLIDGIDQYLDVYKFIPKGFDGYPIDLFRSCNNSGNCEMKEVTHWMSLPDLASKSKLSSIDLC